MTKLKCVFYHLSATFRASDQSSRTHFPQLLSKMVWSSLTNMTRHPSVLKYRRFRQDSTHNSVSGSGNGCTITLIYTILLYIPEVKMNSLKPEISTLTSSNEICQMKLLWRTNPRYHSAVSERQHANTIVPSLLVNQLGMSMAF